MYIWTEVCLQKLSTHTKIKIRIVKVWSVYTDKITYFSECIFCVYLIPWFNQRLSLYLVWKSIICSTKSLLNHPYIYLLKGEIHVLNLNRISVIRIDFFASQNLFVEIKTRSTTFIFWPPQDYQPFEIKTTTNVSSFVILDCRKSNNSCILSRLLIRSRTWSKWKSCWSHFIFCNSILKWKYQQGIRTYDWSSDSHYFVFIICFHSWSETETYIKWRLR